MMPKENLSDANKGDNSKLSLSPQVRHRALEDDGIVVHLLNGRVIVVNEVGLYIIQSLEKPKTRKSLLESITNEFDVAPQQAESDLVQFLNDLGQEDIIERGESIDLK
jgi:hypothetical protein